MSTNERRRGVLQEWRWAAQLAVVATAIAALITVLAFCGFLPASWVSFWQGMSALGVALTLLAVFIAIQIFRRQTRESSAANQDHSAKLDALSDGLQDLARMVRAPLSPTEAEYANLPVDEDEARLEQAAIDQGQIITVGDEDGRVYERDEVPLFVVGDLVTSWREMPDQDGQWNVSNLIGAFRANGQGNKPWYVTFQASNGETRVWRLYRGGRGKRTPTARDITGEISGD